MKKKILHSYGSKVLLALILVSIIPLTIYLNSNVIMVKKYFSILENKNIESNIEHAEKIIQNEIDSVDLTARDYAIWDDIYEKMPLEGRDIEWIRNNFSMCIPDNFGTELMVLAGNDMEIIDYSGLDESMIPELLGKVAVIDVLKGSYDESDKFPSGITIYGDEAYLFAVSPILKSDFTGPSRGALILGKKVSPELLDSIKDKFGYQISLGLDNQLITGHDSEYLAERFSNLLLKSEGSVIELDSLNIVGKSLVEDISGFGKIKIFVFSSRDIFVSTMSLIKKNATYILVLSFLLITFMSFELKNMIVTPILSLEKQLGKMNKQAALEYVTIKGSAEIKNLANSFNSMVDNLFEKEHENIHLKKKSNTDELTSLYNHRYFHQVLKHSSTSAIDSMSIIFIDVDKFKVVNDIYGHLAGDDILRIVGSILKNSLPENIKAFRYGGEEFTVIAPDYSLEESFQLAEKIRSAVIKSEFLQNQCDGFPITVSLGLASYPHHSKSPLDLLNKADRAMYFAKQNGRNQTYIYNEKIESFLATNNESFMKKEVLLDSALAFAAAIDAKDKYTGKHSEMVTKYSLLLAEKLHLSEEDKYSIRIGALLHDCGKIGIPDSIIGKNGRLSQEEFKVIKEHTNLGNTILKYIIENDSIMSCVRNHHEKWDGSGYPDSLSGDSIHLHARIVSISDAFHAMVSDRPYREALTEEQAIQELRKNSGTQFDPSLVESFIQALQESHEA